MAGRPGEAVPLAAQLRQLRARLGFSQEQLARELGVSFATVNRLESGRSQPSARTRRAIERLMDHGKVGKGTPDPVERQRVGSMTPGELARLPAAQSDFVGRARELAELSSLLVRSRQVSLTGPGGIGKTRLAVEAASRWMASADREGGAVFVSLEHVRPPQSAASAIASRLGVRDKPGTSVTEALLAVLRGMARLLVIDRAERHREEVSALTGELLAGAPELRVLVTSRVVLGMPGEVCWAVPPLACPSASATASDIASCDAVRLFTIRAGERLPGFSLAGAPSHAVGDLCRYLGGLPLAIELIAGWVGTLSVGEMLEQRAALLNYGLPARRRLTDVLRASYDLLTDDQQRVLRMLSVVAGPVSLPDAAAILGASPAEAAVAIRGLVDSSWLVVTRGAEQNRFGMVEVVRMFAGGYLEDTGEAADARRRHAAHFAVLATDSENGLAGADAPAWRARLEWASADLDGALHWADEAGDLDLGLEVSAGLWRWWLSSGRLAVGRSWLGRFIAAAGQPGEKCTTPPGRTERIGRAFIAAAVLAVETGDYPEAVRLARLALDIFEPFGADERMAFAATVLGSAQRYLGEHAEARSGFAKAMAVRAALGDRGRLVAAMNNMALTEIDDGNLDRARELFEQTLVIKRQIGDPGSIAIGLMNLADTLIRMNRWKAADAALREAATLIRGQPQLMGIVLCNEGHLAARQGKWQQAAARYAASVENSRIGGHAHDMLEAMIGLGRACYWLGQSADAAGHLATAEALAIDIGNQRLQAEVKVALTEISARRPDQLPGALTARQAEVLRLLADGMSNKEIAARLFLSPGTVERHLATIYRKLGLGGRVDAARYAIENGLTSGRLL